MKARIGERSRVPPIGGISPRNKFRYGSHSVLHAWHTEFQWSHQQQCTHSDTFARHLHGGSADSSSNVHLRLVLEQGSCKPFQSSKELRVRSLVRHGMGVDTAERCRR